MSNFMHRPGGQRKSAPPSLATGARSKVGYNWRMPFRLLTLLLAPSLLALSAMLSAGCGTQVTFAEPSAGGGGEAGAGGYTFINGSSTSSVPTLPPDDDDTPPPIDDPGCPDKPPPKHDFQCDPYSQGNGDCLAEEACYIFVNYPSEPCGQEIYGAFCSFAGPGSQGDACNGAFDCGAGFVCVISGSGNQCIELCKLEGVSGCAPGMICEPIDVEGFGGCL